MTATLTQRLIDLSAQAPDRECLRLMYSGDTPEVVLTRQQFVDGIRGAAMQLQAAGVQRGDLVVIVQRDLLSLVTTFFGVSMLGAVPSILPFATEKLDPNRYRASMAVLIDLAKPAFLATDAEVKTDVDALLPEDHPHLPTLVVMQPQYLDTLPNTPQDIDPEETALLQHSSGTTGLQKRCSPVASRYLRSTRCLRQCHRFH